MNSEAILKKLSSWVYDNKDRLVLSDEFWASEEFEEAELIDAWFDAQLDEEMSDEDYDMLENSFLSFASTEEGGEYYLWKYDEISTDEAPVIFLGSSGEYDMVAPSLNDFICMLSHGYSFSADSESLRVTWHEDSNDEYKNDCIKFLSSFDGLVKSSTFSESLEKMSKHENFVAMVDSFVEKYAEAL